MKRQAMEVTIAQLEDLKQELITQIEEMKKQGLNPIGEQTFQINIINKTPECSDTWKLEGY